MRDLMERLQARGVVLDQDPFAGTWLARDRMGHELPVEVGGAPSGPTPEAAVASVQAEIASEVGTLAPETGPGFHFDLNAEDGFTDESR